MPSKRHGYLTRKQWLAQRLEDARDKAGGFWVERLLRATRYYYNEFDYKRSPPDTNKQLELYAEAFRRMDALAEIPTFPTHWTDEQRRQFVECGFVVEIKAEESPNGLTYDMRKSPQVLLWTALQLEADNYGIPHEQELIPMSDVVRVEVGPLQPGGDALSYNGMLLHGDPDIEVEIE